MENSNGNSNKNDNDDDGEIIFESVGTRNGVHKTDSSSASKSEVINLVENDVKSTEEVLSTTIEPATTTTATINTVEENLEHEITEDEAALYDRQIRLWGVDAQRKYEIEILT